MRPFDYKRVDYGMTLFEVLAVLAAISILLAMYVSTLPRQRYSHCGRSQCSNNLKQVALATRVWGADNNDKYPTAVPATNGGAMEYIIGPNAWKNFQVMSNELSTTKMVICPDETDHSRFTATNFTYFNNSNVSFFVGVDANEAAPQSILSGDRNLTNGMPLKNALLELTTNRPSGWNLEMHRTFGNIALADGSVLQISNAGLRVAVANTGFVTNRLQIPVLGP